MSFYTNVSRFGNKILYRGYNDSGSRIQRHIKYKPTLFIKTKEKSKYASLFGGALDSVTFDSMSDAREFIRKYEDVDNFEIHGNTNYIAQFITDVWPDNIPYNLKHIDVGYIDIEVQSDSGFPKPEEAAFPVTSITYSSRKSSVYQVWGLKDYDASKANVAPDRLVQYHKCANEEELLLKFTSFFNQNNPDVITGWYIRMFDIPYLINRTRIILGNERANMYSPWNKISNKTVTFKNKTIETYELVGIEQMDYLDVFQKFNFTYGPQESYKLDHIAYVVLGEKKLSYEEYGSLGELYNKNHQKFIDYNIRDVELVERIDKETAFLDQAIILAYKGGVNYGDTMGTTAIWDSIIYRYLHKQDIVIPPGTPKPKQDYPGGYVKDPQVGKFDWVVSFDLNSLYPNLIVQYNMSPETSLGKFIFPNGVEHFLENDPQIDGNYCVAANGLCFSKEKRGVLPSIIIDLYAERQQIKSEMIELKKKKGNEHEINLLNNNQMIVKILLNSLYGALGNQYFRYFNIDIARAITLSGQLASLWAEKATNEYMEYICDKPGDYIIAMDTDSLYVNMGPLIEKFKPETPAKFLSDVAEKRFEPVLSKAWKNLFNKMNGYENRMVMAREKISNRGIWTAKKRYILNVMDNEGVVYDKPKIKITGVEAIKSSTPEEVRKKFHEAFEILMNGVEEDLQKLVIDFKKVFKTLPPESVSFPRGVTDVTKWEFGVGYKKGTPIHVRGSIVYNNHIKSMKLEKRYELIKNGTKIKFCYLKVPNHFHENIIAFPEWLPREFDLEKYIDYDIQYEKTFVNPLKTITDKMNWSIEKISTLDALFA